MDGIALWRDEDIDTIVRMMYVGASTILESKGSDGRPVAHYFATKSESIEFMVKSAYALLSLGYKVVE